MSGARWAAAGLAIGAGLCLAGAALSQDHAELLPEAPIKQAVLNTCTPCHDATEMTTRRMSADRWDQMVSRMIDLGATVSDEERPQIVAYLAKNFGPASAPPAAAAPPATNSPAP